MQPDLKVLSHRIRRCAVRYRASPPCNATHISLNSMGPTPTATPTRTSSTTSARGSSRGSRPRSACHEPDTHDNPRRLVRRLDRHARFSSRGSSRGCPLGMRACTCVNVDCSLLYTISYMYTFTKLHDRRIRACWSHGI